jgi:hypothetical protein
MDVVIKINLHDGRLTRGIRYRRITSSVRRDVLFGMGTIGRFVS